MQDLGGEENLILQTSAVGLDLGNTRVKIYPLLPEATLTPERSGRERLDDLESLPVLTSESRSPEAIVSLVQQAWSQQPTFWHVITVDPSFITPFESVASKKGLSQIVWDISNPIPISNPYESPESLGTDRLLSACAAKVLVPGRPVIIVDAGTAITVDVVNANGEFEGGAIAPGLGPLGRELARAGRQLVNVDLEFRSSFPGRDTDACINLGLHAAFDGALRVLVESARERFADADLLVTGGDGERAMSALRGQGAVHEPSLIHLGFQELERHRVRGS